MQEKLENLQEYIFKSMFRKLWKPTPMIIKNENALPLQMTS